LVADYGLSCRRLATMARENRHGAKTMSGQRRFPDMAQKRCRDRGITPTWRKNDVGTGVFPRHGAKTMSGWRCFPTWRKNDVATGANPRHDAKTKPGTTYIAAKTAQRDRTSAHAGAASSMYRIIFY